MESILSLKLDEIFNKVFGREWYAEFDWAKAPLNRLEFPVITALVYVAVVCLLDTACKKSKLQLKKVQFVHNSILSLWSLLMFVGLVYESINRSVNEEEGSTEWLVCEQKAVFTGPLVFWIYNYHISKYYELLDTVLQLIKGRGPPFFFMHVYHHFTILITSFFWLQTSGTHTHVGAMWNTFVHVWMYGYFALRSIGIKPWWKNYITYLQIIQFSFGMFWLGRFFYEYYFQGIKCQGETNLFVSSAFNVSMLYMFVGVLTTNTKKQKTKKE